MKLAARCSPQARERAASLVLEEDGQHPAQWVATVSVRATIGCTAEVWRVHEANVGVW
jgi:hypothetical protein